MAAASATFSGQTQAIAVDGSGDVFIADRGNAAVREVTGALGGSATVRTVPVPSGTFVSSCASECGNLGPNNVVYADGSLYVTTGNWSSDDGSMDGPGKLLKIDPSSGSVTQVATGDHTPAGIAVIGGTVWVTDTAGNCIECQEIRLSSDLEFGRYPVDGMGS